jgi:hypothetical protein
VVVEIKALACELPSRLEAPLSRLHVPDIRAEAVARGIVASISDTTIWRWLSSDAIRPWSFRSWIFPRDPAFAEKAGRVLDLYARRFCGRRLRPDEYVLSADEKTSIQARVRRHPTAPPGPSRPALVEHEYRRAGAWCYLAAWDVHRATLFGRVEPAAGIAAFDRLVAEVMDTEPYRSARRVFWVVDNGTSHRGQAACERLRRAHRNLRLIHLPVHASWLNQVEIYFSIVQRKVLSPSDFSSLGAVADRLLAFQDHYAAAATPFEWRFTRADLTRLLGRLTAADASRRAAA